MARPAHILLVDDDGADLDLAVGGFRGAGLRCTLHTAHGGREALDYLFGRGAFTDRCRHPLPDLVLCDLKMPEVSGLDVLGAIKSTPGLRRIPVIVLTSSEDEQDRAICYDHGANSYLVKPISFEGFLHVLKTVESYWLDLNVRPPAAGRV